MNEAVLFFFNNHLEALPIYQQLEARILERVPAAGVRVQKTQISFCQKRLFACASFNPARKKVLQPAVWLTVSFGLGYRLDSPRVDAVAEPYPNRWTHHVTVASPEEVDQELLGWIEEASQFSLNK